MKLTDKEMQHFTGLSDALQTAQSGIEAQLDNLTTELTARVKEYDEYNGDERDDIDQYHEDRDHIQLFCADLEELSWIIDDMRGWQFRVKSFTTKYNIVEK